jgi:hypothetical protein
MTSSLEKMKAKRRIALIAVIVILGGFIAFAIFKPDPEEKKYNRLKDLMTGNISGGKDKKLSKEERDQLRRTFEKLSPETRSRLVREVMREHLKMVRKKTANLPEEKKKEIVNKMVMDVRKRFSRMTDAQREKMKADLKSKKGKERLSNAMSVFHTELTAKERELFDPLANEIVIQLNSL